MRFIGLIIAIVFVILAINWLSHEIPRLLSFDSSRTFGTALYSLGKNR